jgi:formylglycine-generating enzyme required for sulfatase activity
LGDEHLHRDPETGKAEVIINGAVPFIMADGAMTTAPATSYAPNDFGLYCMNGNVSELVEGNLAVGGSFMDLGYDIRNQSVANFKGPYPTTGFRPVITYLERE